MAATSKARLCSIQAVAALLDCSPDTARERMKMPGAPKPVDMPGDARWRESDIEDWIDSLV
jgi:predicted DNA-binding transcriptional regulator AlpA